MRHAACWIVNLITLNNFAAIFNCTPARRASDLMKAPALKLSNKLVGARYFGFGRAHRCSTVGLLLLQHFCGGLAVTHLVSSQYCYFDPCTS